MNAVEGETGDSTIPCIERLFITEADKMKKITLATAVTKMNNRQSVQITQRAGQKRKIAQIASSGGVTTRFNTRGTRKTRVN